MTNSLTPERLAALRKLLGTAPPGRLLLTRVQAVTFDIAICRALLDAADDLARVREAAKRLADISEVQEHAPSAYHRECIAAVRAALVGGKE